MIPPPRLLPVEDYRDDLIHQESQHAQKGGRAASDSLDGSDPLGKKQDEPDQIDCVQREKQGAPDGR